MRNFTAYLIAFTLACLVPALVIIIPYALGNIGTEDGYGWVRTINFAGIALIISGAHVLILGLPCFLTLKMANIITWWSSVSAGFVVACIPIAVYTWPLAYPEMKTTASHGNGETLVHTMIDGVPTIAGWFEYFESIVFMGLFGALGGLVFWLAIRVKGSNKSLKDAP